MCEKELKRQRRETFARVEYSALIFMLFDFDET